MRTIIACVISVAVLLPGAGASASSFAGYWDGSVKLPGMALDIHVHLTQGEDGAWSGTIDIPMQGAKDIPLSNITVAGGAISFAIAGVPGNPTFKGALDGDHIAGPFSQNGQTFPFELARGTAQPPRRPQDPVPPFPYTSEDVTFRSGDVTIAGTLTMPEGDGPFTAVVLLTGSGRRTATRRFSGTGPFL